MVGETINNDLKQMITSLGGSPEGLEDNLLSTKLNAIISILGGNPEILADNLLSTKLNAIISLLSGGSGGCPVIKVAEVRNSNKYNILREDIFSYRSNWNDGVSFNVLSNEFTYLLTINESRRVFYEPNGTGTRYHTTGTNQMVDKDGYMFDCLVIDYPETWSTFTVGSYDTDQAYSTNIYAIPKDFLNKLGI